MARTDEGTVELLRRLAMYYPDAAIRGMQTTASTAKPARGLSFTAGRVQSLRHHFRHRTLHALRARPDEGELTHRGRRCARCSGLLRPPCTAGSVTASSPANSHRRGTVAHPPHPWRSASLFVDDAPAGWLAMLEATLAYGVTHQTIMQRVKQEKLKAVHVRTGRRKGLRIEPPAPQEQLFRP